MHETMKDLTVTDLLKDEIHGKALHGRNPNLKLVRETLSRYSGIFAWPTIVLTIISWALYSYVCYMGLTNELSLGWCCALNSLCVYLTFTPMHEATHYNISGKLKKYRWVDEIVGWISGILIYAPYPAFRVLHYHHHAFPNDPEKDPDFFVVSPNKFMCLVRCFMILPYYYINYLFIYRKKEGTKQLDFILTLLLIVSKIIISIYLIHLGYGKELALLWIVPAFIGTFILALTFDLIPHYPHTNQDIYQGSWICTKPILTVLLLGQNYHLIHHLYRKVPFYSYSKVFGKLEEHLKDKGINVLGEK